MRRFLAVFCAVAVFSLAGCSGQTIAGFSENDLLLKIDGSAYRCRDSIETVVADLGDGYEYAEGKSCNYDGLDKTYTYENATFYTNPLPEGDLINEIYTESAAATTSRGIAVGAGKADVLAAYGEPAGQDAAILIYRLSEEIGQPSLCFELEGDRVSAIFLTMEQV
ncbi:hypothetical protein [Harryflintia acetispora]|uniref:hypothetical protein n=1 Tax=Harryflintia acetispora TaxID=1849041 RepID=UPI00189B47A0|nr:hypothetical protein [Harryflintia acetispora]